MKMFFSIMTKNLNWEISTKSLVIFKRWDGVNDKKCQYYGSSLKNSIFFFFLERGGAWKIFFRGGGVNCLKRGAWIVCRFKKGLGKRRGRVFEVGRSFWNPNAHYELEESSYWHKYPKQIPLLATQYYYW